MAALEAVAKGKNIHVQMVIQTPAKTRNRLPSSQIRVAAGSGRSMFFLPISDDNPTRHRPLISYIILGLCLCVFTGKYRWVPHNRLQFWLRHGARAPVRCPA